MPRTTNGATSFTAGFVAAEADTREKSQTTDAQRLASLKPQVRAWSGRLALGDLEGLEVVAKRYEGEGLVPVQMGASDIASALRVSKADADGRLARLIQAGAVEQVFPLGQPTRLRPVAKGAADTARVEKAAELGRRLGDAITRPATKAPAPVPIAKVEDSPVERELLKGLFGVRRHVT